MGHLTAIESFGVKTAPFAFEPMKTFAKKRILVPRNDLSHFLNCVARQVALTKS